MEKSSSNKYTQQTIILYKIEKTSIYYSLLSSNLALIIINPQWLELPIFRTRSHDLKAVWAIEVRLYINIRQIVISFHHSDLIWFTCYFFNISLPEWNTHFVFLQYLTQEWRFGASNIDWNPVNIQRRNNVVSTSLRRRSDVETTLFQRCVCWESTHCPPSPGSVYYWLF